MAALNACWAVLPPPALALRRIGAALGIAPPAAAAPVARSADDAMRQAIAGGLPVMHGRPDDPLLAFLDLPPATTPTAR